MAQLCGQPIGGFWRAIDHQHTIHARAGRVLGKGARLTQLVVAFDGICISPQHHGRGAIRLAELSYLVKDLQQSNP